MRLRVLAVASLLLAAPASAAPRLEFRSTTRFQLRQELDRVRRAPLYEDVMASGRFDLAHGDDFTALALMKVGTTIPRERGDIDLYLLHGTMHWRRLKLRLTAGRQLVQTPAGLRIVDGVHLNGQPHDKVGLHATLAWVRDTERDDFNGGALLLQGGVALHALPGARAGVDLSLRVGPDTSPRLDGRVHADALLPLPLTPRPWVTASMRLDTGEVRRIRGGVSFQPIGPLRFELLGRLDNAVDRDGTMAERLLADMTDSPVGGGGVGIRLLSPGGVALSASYLLTGYRVSEAEETVGHSVDARLAWRKAHGSVYVETMLRSGFGGMFTAVGAGADWTPRRFVTVRVRGQVVPYTKLRKALRVGGWALGEVALSPVPQLEIAVGAEYRSSVLMQHDVRFNARLTVHLVTGRKPA